MDAYIHKIYGYADDGTHVELYQSTSYRITKGLDGFTASKWVASDKLGHKYFKDPEVAYTWALSQDIKMLKTKLAYFEKELSKELLID